MAREELKAEIYTENGKKTHSTQSIICVHFRIVQIKQVYIYMVFNTERIPLHVEFDQSTHNNSNSSSVAFSMHAISKYK